MSKALELAKQVGVSRQAMVHRMKRWPESRWMEPPRPNSTLGRYGVAYLGVAPQVAAH